MFGVSLIKGGIFGWFFFFVGYLVLLLCFFFFDSIEEWRRSKCSFGL